MAPKRKAIPQHIKDKLLVDSMHRCCLCPQHEYITDVHHIVAISEEGPNTEDNLMIICPNCHAKIHRIRWMYTIKQLKMYKERWVNLCAKGLPSEEQIKEKAPGIIVDSLHNQTPPEPNFVGRDDMLKTISKWYKDPKVRIGSLIGWGGVGKSALVRKWYDSLEENKIQPDGIFWWGFYRNAYLDQFLNALLKYISQGQIDPVSIKSNWEKIEKIKEYISQGTYLIILDGLEQMQKGESGDEFGKMQHHECIELLHYLADAPKAGLCLITTRFPLKDLDNWCDGNYKTLPLVDLNIPDAIAMLKKRGVQGDDADLKEVIEKYKGHALSLTSVAGYLKRYYDGNIKHAPDIKFVFSEKERFKDVNKLLRKYADKMKESELVFLNIFSLFRRDVTEKEFVGVFQHKIEGTKFNDVLVKMNNLDFKDLVNGLVDWRLFSYDQAKQSYATHPLIKTYFEDAFYDEDKRLCHKRIYVYFGEHAPEQPKTLEEMQPLFEQIYHSCSAGLYYEALLIYGTKIGGERIGYRISDKLGAWETNLNLIRYFFPNGELSQPSLVTERSVQSWLLNSAGLALINIGRPKEAEEPLLMGIRIYVALKDWRNASAVYENLAELQFRIGEIRKGLESAKKSLEMAEKAGSNADIITSKSILAHIFQLLGKNEEVQKWFKEVMELEREINNSYLYCQRGIFYADFLIINNKLDEALKVTRQNLVICRREKWPHQISRCHCCLGVIERIKENFKEAEVHIQEALKLARKVGVPELEIEALLEYGRLHLQKREYKDATNAGNEVLQLCQRTGFKID
jgi:tetratricopeptide (TPR) repeat protein